MWFGTEREGLFRWDGYEIVTYQNIPNDMTSLSNNLVWDIVEDEEENLWIATGKYANKYNPHTHEFTRFPIYDRDGKLSDIIKDT